MNAFLLGAIWGISGCNPFYSGRVKNWIPAEKELPATIKKVALINRSAIPEEERKRIMDEYKKRGVREGMAQGVLTGGLYGAAYGAATGGLQGILDEQWLKRSPQDALRYLHDRLKECGRLEPIMMGQELRWMGKSDGSLPDPLPLDSIKKIAKGAPEAHAIIALETFLPGGSPQKPEVLVGFRMYDPKTAKIIDEVTITGSKERYYGNNVQEVYRAAVEEYVHRFSVCPPAPPDDERVVQFYVKGSANLQKSKAAIIGRNWNEAISLWEADARTGKGTAAKRAAYNLAVLYDCMCEVEKADEWYKRAVSSGLGQAQYEEWGRSRRSLCQQLNSQLPREKRSY